MIDEQLKNPSSIVSSLLQLRVKKNTWIDGIDARLGMTCKFLSPFGDLSGGKAVPPLVTKLKKNQIILTIINNNTNSNEKFLKVHCKQKNG